jgi:hypothetical protein
MKSSQAFPAKYLKSEDVKSKPRVATISHLEIEEVGEDKRKKPVLYFEDGSKPMVCNKTNFETLEEALGDSDDWSGHKIKIFCARTTFGGKKVDGIRVDAIVPKPAMEDDLSDEVPL